MTIKGLSCLNTEAQFDPQTTFEEPEHELPEDDELSRLGREIKKSVLRNYQKAQAATQPTSALLMSRKTL